MKQVLQSPRTGKLELAEVPAPAVAPGQVQVRNAFSVVSPGTERMAVDFARRSLVGKARSRPDLVRQVTRKLSQEGPLPTYRAVTNRLDAPQPLGYACAGVVESVGAGVEGFGPGDRVACAGAGYANHAEIVSVPESLVVHVPDAVPLEKAAFATLGAIAMQGLRVASPSLGEVAVVIGLGLIGQLTVQLLRANGCRVLGIDLSEERVKRAREQGAEWGAAPGDDLTGWRDRATQGYGADLAIVTAASESSAPIQKAAELCRLKGRVVVVGATAMELDRRTFYEKELELRMSTSYGPGRYDRRYEELGLDYPLPYVRWTEGRNLSAFLDLVALGSVDPGRLDVETVDFAEAEATYERLSKESGGSLAVLFRYPDAPDRARTHSVAPQRAARRTHRKDGRVGVAFLGAGTYAKSVLLPALRRRRDVEPVALVTATGASAGRSAERFGFARFGTDPDAMLSDAAVDLVFVATRHDTHAELACRALRAGKAVWLEKPVGLGPEEVAAVVNAVRETGGFLAVGYNRRFSRHVRALREAFARRQRPLVLHHRAAPGPPPRGTWLTDPATGGGRIVGEVCHFIDLCGDLVGDAPVEVWGHALGRDPEADDSCVGFLRYPDGSSAVIEYLAYAAPDLPKERFEISGDGCTAVCDNFRSTRIRGRGAKTVRTFNQDKGQEAALDAVLRAVREGAPSPFDPAGLEAVSRATFALAGIHGTGKIAEEGS